MKALRGLNLLLAFLAVLPVVAHVLEMPNKLALDGPLWLAVQQHLYRGWGPFYGGPVELGALATTAALLALRRRGVWRQTLLALVCYLGMLAAYFVLNRPVNAALSVWTPATLPPDWAAYRARWESGHALAALFALVGLVALARGWLIERDARPAECRPRGRRSDA